MKFDNVRDSMRKAHAAAKAASNKAKTAFAKPQPKGWDVSIQHNGRDVFTMKASKVIKLALASKR